MAEGTIQLPVDGAGKSLRTMTGGASQPASTHQQVGTLADPDGTLFTLGGASLANGAETAVSSSAVQVIAAAATRKKLILQNTGTANVRVGISGVTATTGLRLTPGDLLIFDMPNCPTNAVFAIREGSVDSIVFAQAVA